MLKEECALCMTMQRAFSFEGCHMLRLQQAMVRCVKRIVVFAANTDIQCRHFQAQLVRMDKNMKHDIFLFNKEREA